MPVGYKIAYASASSCATDNGFGSVGNGSVSVATCPAGRVVSGGGYQITQWSPLDNSRTNSPDQSYPSGNGWAVKAGAKSAASCFRAFAVCLGGN